MLTSNWGFFVGVPWEQTVFLSDIFIRASSLSRCELVLLGTICVEACFYLQTLPLPVTYTALSPGVLLLRGGKVRKNCKLPFKRVPLGEPSSLNKIGELLHLFSFRNKCTFYGTHGMCSVLDLVPEWPSLTRSRSMFRVNCMPYGS